jgi:hypothetical protein
VFPYGRTALCNGRLEPAAGTTAGGRPVGLKRAQARLGWLRVEGRQKKARLKGRADKGLEIFFVNEKVCFGKQQLKYSRTHV